jgi:RHS repeat-associated protein
MRVFSWLESESWDDRGNAIVYRYKAEDSTGVDGLQLHERNRTAEGRGAQRYPKRICYGNRTPREPGEDLHSRTDWMFEVVFDYGEHYTEDQSGPILVSVGEVQPWGVRTDPFSSYRAGFEVRTYRLCRRVLVFHHFPDELGTDDYLVRATHFGYTETPALSLLTSITRSGYVSRDDGTYLQRSVPPLELGYTDAALHSDVHEVDAESLANLPAGLAASGYAYLDLDGDGVAGVLSDQPGGWLFKRNLSPAADGGSTVRFAAERQVVREPATGRRWQWIDVGGDGQLDLVQLEAPGAGYYERAPDGDWEPFVPFAFAPNLAWGAPEVRLVDLTGDGRPDALVFEDDCLRWYPSLGEDGFDRSEAVPLMFDEEQGPRLLHADATSAFHLADLSGDGLTDLVRVRNGEVCYWPSRGYARFGAKVTMRDAPWFDEPDRFDASRLRLADVDGSGTTDLVYLGDDGIQIYANQAGNGWAPAAVVEAFPLTDRTASAEVIDLLGTGTCCLVWSSSLPGDSGRQMRYVDLMGGRKPYLLERVANNLGAETRIHYVSSTRFAIEDEFAGRPWATRLPFPVQVVDRVETYDWIGCTRTVKRNAYHHGFYDGLEREFRGFGMVEQWDTEQHLDDTAFPEAENWDEASWTPPTLTRSWFHTGAFVEAGTVSRHYAHEYWIEPALRAEALAAERAAMGVGDSVLPASLSPEELREAYRALKGSPLRVEVFGESEHPYTVSERSFTVRRVQPRGANRHAVFLTHPRETLIFEYERQPDDPRVTHDVSLEVDDYGNVLRGVSVGYPRRPGYSEPEPTLTPAFRAMLAYDQTRLHVRATANRFTNDLVDSANQPDIQRTPLPCETVTAEITGIAPASQFGGITNLFDFDELDAHWLTLWDGGHDIAYEEIPAADIDGGGLVASVPTRRVVSHARTLYRRNDLTGVLPLAELQSLALPGESYSLALTSDLITRVFGDRVTDAMLGEGGYVQLADADGWWVPTSQVRYSAGDADTPEHELSEALSHFYMPRRSLDPFGGIARVAYDEHDLLAAETVDSLGNTSSAVNDYRTLQPRRVTDANGNRSEVAFDALGLVVGNALMGKESESLGDSIAGFEPDLDNAVLAAHFAEPLADPGAVLSGATTRILYDITAYYRTRDAPRPSPPRACTLARETHVSDLDPGDQALYQYAFAYSDGFGRIIQRKAQAEPGPVAGFDGIVSPRWVGSSWIINNNKGNPVRKYEPFFSATHEFEFAEQVGVASVLFYDPPGRVVATLYPDNTWEKVVRGTWRREDWDPNDTVAIADPRSDADVGELFSRYLGDSSDNFVSWHDRRISGAWGDTPQQQAAEQDAAQKALGHAATPTISHLDSRGRACCTVSDNGAVGRYPTRTANDTENKPLAVFDSLGRRVFEYCLREPQAGGDFTYVAGRDLAGNLLYQNSMDGGERRSLAAISAKPLRSWDARGHTFRISYDLLQRPTHRYVRSGEGPEILVERSLYGEDQPERNLCGRLVRQYDAAGLAINESYDFKGNLLASVRQLAREYRNTTDWSSLADLVDANALDAAAAPLLIEADRFRATTTYDALNRPIQLVTPHSASMRPNIVQPTYNDANLVESLDIWIQQADPPGSLLDQQTADRHAVVSVDYNARGQRTRLVLGNGTVTTYGYDPQTFRLAKLVTQRAGLTYPDDCPSPSPSGWAGCQIQNLSYAYDPVGNVTRIRDDAQQMIFFKNRRVEPGGDYTYNAIYRITRATGREHLGQAGIPLSPPAQVTNSDASRSVAHPSDGAAMGTYAETYAYDPAGNLEQVLHQLASGGWTRYYQYDQPSRITPGETSNRLSATSLPGDSQDGPYSATYTHDAHGNMIQMPHLPDLTWDAQDRLQSTTRQVVNGGKTPETTFYNYDGGGERLRKVTDGQAPSDQEPTRIRERIYLGPVEVYREYGSSGQVVSLERETLHIHALSDRVALIETRTIGDDPGSAQLVRYQYPNHLGSSTLELDDSAAIISYEEYFPFGGTAYQAVRSQTETPKRYRHTGNERDTENDLCYHSARYYAPWLGNWVSCDPAGALDGLNLYAFVRGNPLRFVDRSGLQSEEQQKPSWYRDPNKIAPLLPYANQGEGVEAFENFEQRHPRPPTAKDTSSSRSPTVRPRDLTQLSTAVQVEYGGQTELLSQDQYETLVALGVINEDAKVTVRGLSEAEYEEIEKHSQHLVDKETSRFVDFELAATKIKTILAPYLEPSEEGVRLQHVARGRKDESGVGVFFIDPSKLSKTEMESALVAARDMDFIAGMSGGLVRRSSLSRRVEDRVARIGRELLDLGATEAAAHLPDSGAGGSPLGPISGLPRTVNASWGAQLRRYETGFKFEGFSVVDRRTGEVLYPSMALEVEPPPMSLAR